MNKPTVSVIIPTYNRADLVKETLDSIRTQSLADWECIVVDDGSSDNTSEIVGNYAAMDSRFQYHRRPDSMPKGANSCRNFGLGLSKGIYINWFDSDDLMHPDLLKIQCESLEKTRLDFTVCQALVFNETIENIIGLRHEEVISETPFLDYLYKRILLMTPTVLWRKAFLEKNALRFDLELQAAQEWEFHARVLFDFPKYHANKIPLVYIRKHAQNITNKKDFLKQRRISYLAARMKIYGLCKANKYREADAFFSKYFVNTYFNFKYLGFDEEAERLYSDVVNKSMQMQLLFVRMKMKKLAQNAYASLKRVASKQQSGS